MDLHEKTDNLSELFCKICKQSMYRVEEDYILNGNHLKCELESNHL
jgi:hypothetical protein